MSLLLIGRTVTFLGELLIAVMVLWVHHKVEHDKKIDKSVIRSLKQEWVLASLGVVLLILGYAIEIIAL